MTINHTHSERGGRFFIGDENAPEAQMVYRMAGPHKMIIDHTEVNEKFEGHGYGKQLVAEGVKYAREHEIKILPMCPFAKAIMEKSKDYEDVLIHS